MSRPPITRWDGVLFQRQLAAALDYIESLGGGGGGVSDGDKGDIVVSGSGSVWTLDTAVSSRFATGGEATLNFGAAPGASTATVAVTGQTGIVVGSRVRAWIQGSTADHNAYEHSTILPMMVDLGIGDIVAGTGFTIYASTEMRLTGTIAVKWEWA